MMMYAALRTGPFLPKHQPLHEQHIVFLYIPLRPICHLDVKIESKYEFPFLPPLKLHCWSTGQFYIGLLAASLPTIYYFGIMISMTINTSQKISYHLIKWKLFHRGTVILWTLGHLWANVLVYLYLWFSYYGKINSFELEKFICMKITQDYLTSQRVAHV